MVSSNSRKSAKLWSALLLLALAFPAHRAGAQSREFMAELVARGFFRALLSGSVDAALALCDRRVNLDGRWVSDPAAVEAALSQIARRAQTTGLRLRRVHLLTLRQMRARFGPPPHRLRTAVRAGDFVVLARFNRQGAVAVLGRRGRFWRIRALSD